MRAPLLAASVLSLPIAAGAVSETTDPEGDVIFLYPFLPDACDDPAIDLTRARVSSDGETLEVLIGVRDAGARPSCGPLQLRHRELVRTFEAVSDANIDLRFGSGLSPFGAWACGSFGISEGGSWWASQCLGETFASGDTVIWRVPTHGLAPTYGTRVFEYDLRGKTLWPAVSARSQGALEAGPSFPFQPVHFYDEMVGIPPFTI
ncbi:MAG TPA: hypothetical protein VM582_03915 [Candidatus Thermoplasmatota archaeon]|nr:hypothetical protein [Candidatus Thermoplasmatota archaeon]